MIFVPCAFAGVYQIELELRTDERGGFARTFCRREFEEHGLVGDIAQCNMSYNEKRGTLRGMHFQISPDEEDKVVSCASGEIFDVIIDLRPRSATCEQWMSFHLKADDHQMIYIPKGFAHGFQTLADHTNVYYLMTQFYAPASGCGIRWDDPKFKILWPVEAPILSDKDRNWPLWGSV